ncbi:DUF2520 domain-containing protein [Porticoccaceae bacterium LTM1]|nr:DUF2520 domain-containing protein [Porticoccaceae bacterium LTM1]
MMKPKLSLNLIGCGKLGRTLAKLWLDNGGVEIGGIVTRHMESAQQAIGFVGSGTYAQSIQELPKADIWLIATPDSEIANAAQQLADAAVVTKGNVVFHCSGALPSSILAPLGNAGAKIASAHPIHSFADPQRSLGTFKGTFCAVEGDQSAQDILIPLFEKVGARTFSLSSENKPLYHAATAVASNYLVTLLHTAASMLEKAGMQRKQALEMLEPIVLQTASNTCQKDSVDALTGPIARGDVGTIEQHLKAIASQSPEFDSLYRLLGEHTLPLAEIQGAASKLALTQLAELLSSPPKS